MEDTKSQWGLWGMGLFLMLIALAMLFIFPCPSEFIYWIVRVILAVGVGLLARSITGSFKLRYKKMISAGGGFAAFVLVYLWNPPALASAAQDCDKCNLAGLVFVDDKLTENVKIGLPSLEKQRLANRDGRYEFEILSCKSLQGTLMFRIMLDEPQRTLDTTFELDAGSFDPKALNFYLISKRKTPPPTQPSAPDPKPKLSQLLIKGSWQNISRARYQGQSYTPQNGLLALPLSQTMETLTLYFSDGSEQEFRVFNQSESISLD